MENENVKMIKICKGVAPELTGKDVLVDVAHTLGRPMLGQARVIIILLSYQTSSGKCKKTAKKTYYALEKT